jgi:transglutaminase-like putative cysteine protease
VPAAPGVSGTAGRRAPDAAAAMVLEVEHETLYRYHGSVELAQHIAFLRPRDDAAQRLLDFRLQIEPPPSQLRSDLDAFGNVRTLFALNAPHESLRVVARSRVRVSPPEALPPAPAWEAARGRWRYVAGRAPDPAAEFAFASPLLPQHPALRAWAEPSFPPGRPLDEAALDLMHRLHRDFDYVPDSTEVDTPVLEVLLQRRGVCQDFAQLLIAGLRAMGLAARYVSGYLLTEPPPGQPRLQGADASHAWAALALPGADGAPAGWLELDPTNDCVAAAAHVRLAVGRDYGDVPPLRGVIRGGGRHRLQVRVSTRPAD